MEELISPDCFLGLSPEGREQAVYTALYSIAGDSELPSVECFAGSSQEARRSAMFSAAYILAAGSDALSTYLQPDGESGYFNSVGDQYTQS